MSIKVMTYVWDGFPAAGSELLAMLALADWSNIASQSSHGQVKYAHCKKIAVGCGSPVKARGMSRNTARYAAFSIPATSFGGSDGMAKAMPGTLRVPPVFHTHSSCRPMWKWNGSCHQAQLEPIMAISPDASSRQRFLVSQLISAQRIPFGREKSFCVYMLYREDQVVYVGSSMCIAARISQHSAQGKEFDSYSSVAVESIEEMHELEVRCIARFNPEYNMGLNSTSKSGFVGMSNLKVRYGLRATAIKKVAQKFKVETLYFRGLAYYNEKEAHAAISSLGATV